MKHGIPPEVREWAENRSLQEDILASYFFGSRILGNCRSESNKSDIDIGFVTSGERIIKKKFMIYGSLVDMNVVGEQILTTNKGVSFGFLHIIQPIKNEPYLTKLSRLHKRSSVRYITSYLYDKMNKTQVRIDDYLIFYYNVWGRNKPWRQLISSPITTASIKDLKKIYEPIFDELLKEGFFMERNGGMYKINPRMIEKNFRLEHEFPELENPPSTLVRSLKDNGIENTLYDLLLHRKEYLIGSVHRLLSSRS